MIDVIFFNNVKFNNYGRRCNTKGTITFSQIIIFLKIGINYFSFNLLRKDVSEQS